MSRMPPGHVCKQPLVESMDRGDFLQRLQHRYEGESKGEAANCKELLKTTRRMWPSPNQGSFGTG